MAVREIKMTGPVIRNGRIYFPSSDVKFLPADSFGDWASNGHKGRPVIFRGGLEVQSDIRIRSGQRTSPTSSFSFFLCKVHAKEGGRLRVTQLGEREYSVEYLP